MPGRLTSRLQGLALYLVLGMRIAAGDSMPFSDGDLLEQRIAEVNEGELRLLGDAPAATAPLHESEIKIVATSLEDGWVELRQCHSQLDPVGAVEIVYRPKKTRNLRIVETRHIDSARVEDASVQLRGVQADAEVCVYLESRALSLIDRARYRLSNGPYMRRFLDGYYPLRLSVRIDYPSGLLQPADIDPLPQPGFLVRRVPGRIELEARFEGRLHTRIDFCRTGDLDCPGNENR